jgi:enoyl-CoA hydratase/carnithine racemase
VITSLADAPPDRKAAFFRVGAGWVGEGSAVAYQYLEISRRGSVAVVALDRPERLNALNRDLMLEITQAASAFQEDVDTRVVVFTGNGKHFSAGADLRDPDRTAGPDATRLRQRRAIRSGPDMIRSIFEMNQITIAAINGVALGGGACIATACDFRIGAHDSFCGYPEINRGMNLSWVALPLCVHLIGPSRAKRMIALGRKEDAETLLRWGFYDEVVDGDQLMEKALSMAEDYAGQPPLAAQMIKQSVNAVVSALDRVIMHMDHDQWMLTTSTEDYREGIKSFFEKRKPEFTGN